jgi:HEAT repeat protein
MSEARPVTVTTHIDVHLQAYLLKRLCRQSAQTVLANADGFATALAGFDAATAADVLAALVQADPPGLSQFLLKLLATDPRWHVQVRLIGLLAARASEPRVVPTLVALVSQAPDPRVRACALSSLGRIPHDIPLKLIKPYFTHAEARMRAAALEAILARDLSGMTEVLELMLNDECARVKALAAVGLWRLGNPVLLDLLRDAEQPEHRLAYLHALGMTGHDGQPRRLLVHVLTSGPLAERAMACRSLRAVAESEDIPVLLQAAVEVPGRETRAGVVSACAQIDRERTHACLRAMLGESESQREPRRIASLLSMLAAAPGEPDLEYVSRFLDNPDGRVRANAVDGLSDYSGLPRIHAALLRCYESEISRVRANAALPLWKAGYQVVMRGLKEMLSSSEAGLRASAAWALGRVGGIVAASYLEKALDDPDEATRRLAYQGLSGS